MIFDIGCGPLLSQQILRLAVEALPGVNLTSAILTTPTLDTAVAKGTWTASGTWTIPAATLGGTLTLNGQTLSGQALVSNASALQAIFTGYTSIFSSANATHGSIRIGSTDGLVLDFYAAGATTCSISSLYDNTAAAFQIRMRQSGTPVIALSILGTGAATFIGEVSATAFKVGSNAALIANGINFGPSIVTSITVVNGQVTAIS